MGFETDSKAARRRLYAAYEEAKRLAQAGAAREGAAREGAVQAGAAREGAVQEGAPHRRLVIAGEPEAGEDGVRRKKLFGEVPCMRGERIVLDRVVDADARALRDLIDNPLVQRYLPTYLFEKQFDDVHEAISLLYGDLFANGESLILAIRTKGEGELAGLAEFYGLRDRLHKVSVGYRLRECFWGRGLATEAARLMVAYLYGETDIEIITASTMMENAASAHVLEKADFIRTARAVEEDWGFPEPTIVDKWFC